MAGYSYVSGPNVYLRMRTSNKIHVDYIRDTQGHNIHI